MPVGRLIFKVNAPPVVRPMNFAHVDELIVLRTAAGTTVDRKVDDMIVASRSMISMPRPRRDGPVTLTGRAVLVADPEVIAQCDAVPLVPWAPGVRISL